MSSSTRRRPLVDVMLESIADLTKARPHMHESARYDMRELKAYNEGYYTGVCYAMKVAELGAERFKLRVKLLRAETRRKRSA